MPAALTALHARILTNLFGCRLRDECETLVSGQIHELEERCKEHISQYVGAAVSHHPCETGGCTCMHARGWLSDVENSC